MLGPMIIFDKSTLQSLSVDESCWLQNFFLSNVTPLLYVETLADLEKEGYGSLTPQQVVGDLALKTPSNVYPNIDFHTLVIHDLLGNPIEMSNRPIIRGGETKLSPEGKIGVHFKEFPETEALSRWQKGEFLEIERDFAKKWRQTLSNLNFDAMIGQIKNIVLPDTKLSSLRDVKNFVDGFVKGKYKQLIYLACDLLGVPDKARAPVIKRWQEKWISFDEFAPYAAYILKVDLLFYISIMLGFESKNRPSNKVDLAYLYYLPFCNIFVSNDRLHARLAPLFMEHGQTFIKGQDLKSSLKQLDDHYSKLPEEVKVQGIMRFAVYPPEEMETVVHQLWDKYLPIWRKHDAQKKAETDFPKDSDKKLVEHLNKVEKESVPIQTEKPITADEADYVMFKREMPVRKGKWRLIPPEAEEPAKSV